MILPGTKTTIADLEWLRRARLAERILGLAAAGSAVLGICGGYQMLGRRLRDPQGVEAPGGADVPGLGLLPVETVFLPRKARARCRGASPSRRARWPGPVAPRSPPTRSTWGRRRPSRTRPSPPVFILEDGRPDGTLAPGGRVAGTYLHGAFECQPLRRALLTWGAARNGKDLDTPGTPQSDAEAEYDRLAAVLRQALDVPLLYRIAGLTP